MTLPLPEPKPHVVDVDRRWDNQHEGIQFLGNATLQPNGMYRCLANVYGSLCVVEVRITPE